MFGSGWATVAYGAAVQTSVGCLEGSGVDPLVGTACGKFDARRSGPGSRSSRRPRVASLDATLPIDWACSVIWVRFEADFR